MPKKTRYRITLVGNNKQKKVLVDLTDFTGVTETYESMLKNNKVILPQKYVNTNGIIPMQYHLVLSKTKEDGDKNRIIRNELGKLVEETTTNNNWSILDKKPFLVEETFWVYGYNHVNERFTTAEIVVEILMKDLRKKNIVKTIRTVHNKLIIQSDYDDFNMIICKCEEDAKRLYNKLLEASKKTTIKRLLFMGNATTTESVTRMYDIILDNTDWSIEKIRRLTTRP
jgi:hypothetical protein